MNIISWNVNGLRALHGKEAFLPFFDDESPDVLLLQETKGHVDQLPGPVQDVTGYTCRFQSAKKKGYSGVAIYSRDEPDEWFDGLGDDEFDDEGRVLGARYGDLVVVSAYFPNSQAAGKRLDYRLRFGAAMHRFLDGVRDRGWHVALGGDYNVAHQPIDLARPKPNEKNPGYLPEERAWMTAFLETGYVDTWRHQNPELAEVYSWWSYRTAARPKNIGWRLDYLCVDEGLLPRLGEARILTQTMGSDHCPVALRLTSADRADGSG